MTPLSVGFIGPLPPTRSGIADYDSEILSSLSKKSSLSLFFLRTLLARMRSSPGTTSSFSRSARPFARPVRRGAVSPAAAGCRPSSCCTTSCFTTSSRRPTSTGAGRPNTRAPSRRSRRARPAFAEEERRGPARPRWDLDPWAFPLSAGVVRAADAVIAHSALVRGAVLRESPKTRAVEIPHHVVEAPRTRRERGAARARAAARPPGRGVPRRRDAREEDREDPGGDGGAAARPTSVPVRGRRGRRRRSPPPIRRRARSHRRRGVRRIPLGRGLLACGVRRGLRREPSAPDDGRDVRSGLPPRRLRPPARRLEHGLVPRAAGRLRVEGAGRGRGGAASRGRDGGARVRRGAHPHRAAAAIVWGEARRPDRVADAYADVLLEAAEGRARPRGLSGSVARALAEIGVGRAGALGAASREPDATLVAAVASRLAPLLPETREEKRFSRRRRKEREEKGS